MTANTDNGNALPKGYELNEYYIESQLGVGGFGITYLATDIHLKAKVAIKEYFPNDLAIRTQGYSVQAKSAQYQADFDWGLKRFLEEGQTLAKFQHPNIIKVLRYFKAHRTAYIVMEYEEGESLKEALKRNGGANEAEIQEILPPLLDGLQAVHEAGFLHRDIKPDNIFLRDSDHSPVLLDFGAARYAMGGHSRSMTSIVAPGYSPFEQYETDGKQGPWSDIYAMGAVLYRIISGKHPVEATKRVNAKLRDEPDPLVPAVEIGGKHYSSRLLQCIDWALEVMDKDRPQSVKQWARELFPDFSEKIVVTPEKPEKSGFNKWVLIGAMLAIGIIAGYVFARLQTDSPKTTITSSENSHTDVIPAEIDVIPAEIDTPKPDKFFRDFLRDGSLGPKMVRIPAGSFRMGDIQGGGYSSEKPVHRVSVDSFAMGQYEVTFAEYDKFANATGRSKPSDSGWGRGNRPVINVSWNDSTAYAKWLSQQTGKNYRLPTEAEWEYAARAGTETKYWWGNDVGSNNGVCDGCGSRWDDQSTAPVGSFEPNPFGLYDTAGNVWEWVQDWYDSNYYSVAPPKSYWTVFGGGRYRVFRGGSWGGEHPAFSLSLLQPSRLPRRDPWLPPAEATLVALSSFTLLRLCVWFFSLNLR